jgi:hypothetical protein
MPEAASPTEAASPKLAGKRPQEGLGTPGQHKVPFKSTTGAKMPEASVPALGISGTPSTAATTSPTPPSAAGTAPKTTTTTTTAEETAAAAALSNTTITEKLKTLLDEKHYEATDSQNTEFEYGFCEYLKQHQHELNKTKKGIDLESVFIQFTQEKEKLQWVFLTEANPYAPLATTLLVTNVHMKIAASRMLLEKNIEDRKTILQKAHRLRLKLMPKAKKAGVPTTATTTTTGTTLGEHLKNLMVLLMQNGIAWRPVLLYTVLLTELERHLNCASEHMNPVWDHLLNGVRKLRNDLATMGGVDTTTMATQNFAQELLKHFLDFNSCCTTDHGDLMTSVLTKHRVGHADSEGWRKAVEFIAETTKTEMSDITDTDFCKKLRLASYKADYADHSDFAKQPILTYRPNNKTTVELDFQALWTEADANTSEKWDRILVLQEDVIQRRQASCAKIHEVFAKLLENHVEEAVRNCFSTYSYVKVHHDGSDEVCAEKDAEKNAAKEKSASGWGTVTPKKQKTENAEKNAEKEKQQSPQPSEKEKEKEKKKEVITIDAEKNKNTPPPKQPALGQSASFRVARKAECVVEFALLDFRLPGNSSVSLTTVHARALELATAFGFLARLATDIPALAYMLMLNNQLESWKTEQAKNKYEHDRKATARGRYLKTISEAASGDENKDETIARLEAQLATKNDDKLSELTKFYEDIANTQYLSKGKDSKGKSKGKGKTTDTTSKGKGSKGKGSGKGDKGKNGQYGHTFGSYYDAAMKGKSGKSGGKGKRGRNRGGKGKGQQQLGWW